MVKIGRAIHTAMHAIALMSEHKAYESLVELLNKTVEKKGTTLYGTRAAIALTYLEIVSYKDRSKASRISMLSKEAQIMEGYENRTE